MSEAEKSRADQSNDKCVSDESPELLRVCVDRLTMLGGGDSIKASGGRPDISLEELVRRLEENFKTISGTNDSLRTVNEELHGVFDLVGVAVVVVDANHTIIAHNRAAQAKFSQGAPSIMHRKCCYFICGHDSPPRDCPVILANALGANYEKKGMGCQGRIYDVVASPVREAGGEIFRTVLAFSDITARQETMDRLARSEARYRDIFENTSDLIQISDMDGNILYVNESWRKTTGISDPSGVGLKALIAPEKLEMFMSAAKASLEKEETLSFETEYVAAGGQRVLLDGNISWSPDSGGGRTARAIMRDVTRQRRMEEELATARRLDHMGKFAAGVAHDFNNILTAILGNISLARMYESKGFDAADKLKKAEQGVLRARDLTRKLFSFGTGNDPVKKDVSLPELVTDAVNFILSGSNVRAEYHFSKDVHKVEADPGQIEQVIQNLAINSAEATEHGGVITVGLKNVTVDKRSSLPLPPGAYVLLSVADRGVGIPKEDIARIFEPFYTTKDGAKGLGLTSAFSLVKKHDGAIVVESKVGRGTRMDVYLPAIPVIPEIPASAVRESERAACAGRILVMDDEEDIRDLLGSLLTHNGYDVVTAPDGAAAVDLYTKAGNAGKPFDLVVLDLTIPGGMGGQETMEALLDIDPKINAIVSSGYASDPVLVSYRDHGFKGVAVKPYKMDAFLELIRSLAGK